MTATTLPLFAALFPGLSGTPNLHPLFVHAPVVLIPLATAVWAVALVRKDDGLFKAGRWLLALGVLGGLAAIAAGFVATNAMGHDGVGHDLVHVHKNLMIAATALAAVVSVVSYLVTGPSARKFLLAALVVAAAVTAVGADRGAVMVFKYSIGTAGETPPTSGGHSHGSTPDDHGSTPDGNDSHDEGSESSAGSPEASSEDGHGGHAH